MQMSQTSYSNKVVEVKNPNSVIGPNVKSTFIMSMYDELPRETRDQLKLKETSFSSNN